MTGFPVDAFTDGIAAGSGWLAQARNSRRSVDQSLQSLQGCCSILLLATMLLGFYDHNPIFGDASIGMRQ